MSSAPFFALAGGQLYLSFCSESKCGTCFLLCQHNSISLLPASKNVIFSCFPSPSSCPCFLHLCSCNLLLFFSPSSPSVHSGFAASYLPPVKAVPKLLKSLLPGGKEDSRDQTAVHQQVHSVSSQRSGFKFVFCSLSYQGFKVSVHHCSLNLNIPSTHQQLVLFLPLPWKQSLCTVDGNTNNKQIVYECLSAQDEWFSGVCKK